MVKNAGVARCGDAKAMGPRPAPLRGRRPVKKRAQVVKLKILTKWSKAGRGPCGARRSNPAGKKP